MKEKFTTKNLTRVAILAALSVVLRRFFTITIPVNQKIGLGYMPIIMSGILYGPILGGMTGALADVVGMLLNPDGVFHLGFTLSAFLMGYGPGFISYKIFNKNFKGKINWIILLSCIFTFMVCRLLIDSIWLQQYSKNPYWIYVVRRIPKQIFETILNFFILRLLIPRIETRA